MERLSRGAGLAKLLLGERIHGQAPVRGEKLPGWDSAACLAPLDEQSLEHRRVRRVAGRLIVR